MTDSRVSVPTNRLGSRHSQRTKRRRMAACSADVVYAYTCGGHEDDLAQGHLVMNDASFRVQSTASLVWRWRPRVTTHAAGTRTRV